MQEEDEFFRKKMFYIVSFPLRNSLTDLLDLLFESVAVNKYEKISLNHSFNRSGDCNMGAEA